MYRKANPLVVYILRERRMRRREGGGRVSINSIARNTQPNQTERKSAAVSCDDSHQPIKI